MKGEHKEESFIGINMDGRVPVLVCYFITLSSLRFRMVPPLEWCVEKALKWKQQRILR